MALWRHIDGATLYNFGKQKIIKCKKIGSISLIHDSVFMVWNTADVLPYRMTQHVPQCSCLHEDALLHATQVFTEKHEHWRRSVLQFCPSVCACATFLHLILIQETLTELSFGHIHVYSAVHFGVEHLILLTARI